MPLVEFHERRRMTVDQLLRVEAMLVEPSPIIDAYRQWRQNIMPEIGVCGVIGMEHENPFKFDIQRHMHISIKHLDGLRLAEHPLTHHARLCGPEYYAAKASGAPVCHYVDQLVPDGKGGWWERDYVRIILPDKNRKKAHYIVRYLRPPRHIAPARLEAVR